jgi:hypothetical protein
MATVRVAHAVPLPGAVRGAGAKASTAEELARQLLHAAGARMTSVDIDELGPGVPVARIGLTGPVGSGNVTARLPDGQALAITAGTQIPGSERVPSNPLNLKDALADAGTTFSTAAGTHDWAQHEVTVHVPGDCRIILFGILLAGSGRIELREPELARCT